MFYRSKSGDLVEAARFNGGHVNSDNGFCFETDEPPTWLADAMNAKVLELSALGSGLVLNHRGGSYGIAVGDWVIRLHGGELTHCRGDRFEQEYEAV